MTMSTLIPTSTISMTERPERRPFSARLFAFLENHGRRRALLWLDQQPDGFLKARGLDRKTMEENIRSV